MKATVAIISSDLDTAADKSPFGGDSGHNDAYAHLIELAAAAGQQFVLAHPEWCKGKQLTRCWLRQQAAWQVGEAREIGLVWDRDCRPTREKANFFQPLFEQEVPIVNAWPFDVFVSDKHQNFYLAPDRVPFGLCIGAAAGGLQQAVNVFRASVLADDLSTERLILKPRTSHGGEGLIVLERDTAVSAVRLDDRFEYLLQGFLETAAGIPELEIEGRHDLRVVVADGEPVVSFARLPDSGQVVSNIAAGGSRKQISLEALPAEARLLVAQIDRELQRFPYRLYSVDMARGASGRWWVFEINARPGFAWDPNDSADIACKEELHREAIRWFTSHFDG